MKLNKLAHYGDFIAIPCFFIVFIYFYNLENKSVFENLIMFFIFITMLMDIFFSIIFLTTK